MLPYGCLVTNKLSIATYISPEIDFPKKNPIYCLAVIFIHCYVKND